MLFSLFRWYQKYGKKENILEKSVLAPDFTSAQLGQYTTNEYTHQRSRDPH